MKPTLGILLSTMLLCGCSQRHTYRIDQTIDVVAGKDIVVLDWTLKVKKRDGNSLEGVRLVNREPDGKETIITADTGTLAQGPKQTIEVPAANAKDQRRSRVVLIRNSVKLILFNANVQTATKTGTTRMTVEKLELDLQRL